MEAARRDLTLIRGDDYSHVITFTPTADLSAAMFAAQLRLYPDAVADTAFTIDGSQLASSILTIVLSAEATAALGRSYAWDLQMTLAGVTTTVLAGSVTVTPDVTR